MPEIDSLPICDVFRTDTTAKLIGYFLEQDHERWIRKTDIEAETDINIESIRQRVGTDNHPGLLEQYGIIERNEWDVNMPRYRVTDSDVVKFLREYDGYPFPVFFKTKARRVILMFFIRQDHAGETYTRSSLSEELGINFETIKDMMNQLESAGIVVGDDNGYSIDYQHIPESHTEQSIKILDDLLAEEAIERIENFPPRISP